MTDESNSGWDVLEIEGVMQVARKAAARVASEYEGTIERDDAEQEAAILLATKADMVREVLGNPELGLGVLYRRLVQDLTDLVKTEAKRRSKHVSYESAREGHE